MAALEHKKKKKYVYKTEPWEHQKKALSYLYKRDAAALYTDMGTGKTKVMIDLIQSRDFKRVLVVAPKKACDVWVKQIAIHGVDNKFVVFPCQNLSKAKVTDLLSKIPKKTTVGLYNETYVFIINYEKVWDKNIERYLERKTFGLDCVICDESHRIKSPRSNCSMALARIGQVVTHRYLVTGTPLAENPVDVFAQYKFLDRSIFGTNLGRFRDEYEVVDAELSARIGHRILNKATPYKNLEQLHEKMFSCAFYIHSSIELPEQTDIDYRFNMPVKSEKIYKEFMKEKVVGLSDEEWASSSNALTTVLRLQQITSGYLCTENLETKEKKVINIDHARAEALMELLEDFPEGEPIVVFAHYKKDLKNIRIACKKMGLTYSEVSGSVDTLNEWLDGRTQILGVQYSSGSESIDLTRARYCIYYSLTQRLALYEQSRKRIHRPGQTRPVVYYHMISTMSRGYTIDEKIYAALKQKKDIVDYVMEKGWE